MRIEKRAKPTNKKKQTKRNKRRKKQKTNNDRDSDGNDNDDDGDSDKDKDKDKDNGDKKLAEDPMNLEITLAMWDIHRNTHQVKSVEEFRLIFSLHRQPLPSRRLSGCHHICFWTRDTQTCKVMADLMIREKS